MRSTLFPRLTSALILTSLLALPVAASADGGSILVSGGKSTTAGPAFGSGAGVAEKDGGGYFGSGLKEDGGVIGSGTKDGGIITTSGGLRAWTRQLQSLARLALAPWVRM
jgi:hypothetical protein